VAEVVVDYGGKEVLRVPLKGPSMTIGRDPQCDLHLDNRALSRRHALIEKRGAAIWVKDLKSQNGTFVNGERVSDTGQPLNGGDAIEVGRYQIRIDGVDQARTDTPVLTLTGPEGRHRFAMVGDEIILGRAPSCDIAIGHKSISRRHMRIAIEGDHFIAEDLGSQNGSRINNRRINGPTPFKIGDKVQMSEFTIEVNYLEAPQAEGPKKANKTMMIDRSELAKAAYVEGDFANGAQAAGNISLGQQHSTPPRQQSADFDDEAEEIDSTRGLPSVDELPPPPQRAAPQPQPQPLPAPPQQVLPPGLPPAQPPQPVRRKPPAPVAAPPPQDPVVVISHPDYAERSLFIDHDVVMLGEDGSDGDTTDGRAFANHGYILLTRTVRGVMASVAGDRRLLVVNGQAQVTALLQEGDVLELGMLAVVFHQPG
jgi:pSer/pThr/pTyr-binding forkhead associated (FHA) protein